MPLQVATRFAAQSNGGGQGGGRRGGGGGGGASDASGAGDGSGSRRAAGADLSQMIGRLPAGAHLRSAQGRRGHDRSQRICTEYRHGDGGNCTYRRRPNPDRQPEWRHGSLDEPRRRWRRRGVMSPCSLANTTFIRNFPGVKMSLRNGLALLLLSLVVSLPFAASAQQATSASGTVHGLVVDPDDALIPGATATLTSASGKALTGTSKSDGTYSIRGVSAGTYTLTVTAPGFASFVKPGIIVATGSQCRGRRLHGPAGHHANRKRNHRHGPAQRRPGQQCQRHGHHRRCAECAV